MIVDSRIENYINSFIPPRDPVLAEMERDAAARRIPIVGPAVGGLLAQLVELSGSTRIFELGSAIGYSTIWLARAAGRHAEVHYSDRSTENAREARAWFERAGISDRIIIHIGDALEALRLVPGEFDLIFNDVDKQEYPVVLEQVPPRLRRSGVFVTDNALWHGTVLDPQDSSSRAVVEFTRKLFTSAEFFTTLLPVRDGVTISIKR